MLISVIVTVYNKVEYIEQCLRSILDQTYHDIEIIVVNDGSTDGSETVCNELASQDSRIKVYTQCNQGLVKSRKFGASKAKGEFISFVDGDDWIDREMIDRMVKEQKENDADIVLCNYYNCRKDKLQSRNFALGDGFYSLEGEETGIFDAYFKINTDCATMHNVCEKLIRKCVFTSAQELVDDQVTRAEDLVFSYALLHLCNGIQVVNKPMYFYRWVEDSMIHSVNVSVLRDVEIAYENILHIRKILGNSWRLDKNVDVFFRRWMDNLSDAIWGNYSIRYIFPYECIKMNSKVILYGMGKVGKSFKRQIENGQYCELVGIMDSNKIDQHLMSLDDVHNSAFDYIVISVLSEKSAESIRERLINYGVEDSKIVWTPPVSI